MANGHDGGVGGMMFRIFDAHYRGLKLQPLSQLSLTAPLAQGSYGTARDLSAVEIEGRAQASPFKGRWHGEAVTER